MIRGAGIAFLLLSVSACSGPAEEPTASSPVTATTPATSSPSTTTTSTVPTTTTTTTQAKPTTTQPPPSTTAIPTGASISRDTATKCIDQWVSEQRSGANLGFYFGENLVALDEVCEEAATLVEVDLVGVANGPYPARQLASLVTYIGLLASTTGLFAQCASDGSCPISDDYRPEYLVLPTIGVPTAFQGQIGPLADLGLDDCFGVIGRAGPRAWRRRRVWELSTRRRSQGCRCRGARRQRGVALTVPEPVVSRWR
jgi:hypothetical protein